MKTWIIATVVGTVLVSSQIYAGKQVKMCRDEDGNAYMTDVSCPNDTERLGTAYIPSGPQYHREWTQQIRPIPQSHEQPIPKNVATRAAPVQQPQQPAMTYEDARAAATKDAGYRKYGQLTKSQKDRVHKEMAKYNHLPPVPQPESAQATVPQQQQLLIDGLPAVNTGPNTWWDPQSGHYLHDAGGMVWDQNTGQYHLKQ